MPKGPIVTPGVEALIASLYYKHPKWKAPAIRHEVESILRKKDRTLPKGWPSLSKVQKVLAGVRGNADKPRREDMLWSMGTLNEFPIPPEVIPYVLDVWKLRLAQGKTFTIRDAKWVARLSGFQLQELAITKQWSLANVKVLSYVAGVYARLDLLFELLGYTSCPSHYLDKILMSIPVDVSVCPGGHEDWTFLDTLALEGEDMFKKATKYLRAKERNRLSDLEHNWFLENVEVPGETQGDKDVGWIEDMKTEWEEYKKEARSD